MFASDKHCIVGHNKAPTWPPKSDGPPGVSTENRKDKKYCVVAWYCSFSSACTACIWCNVNCNIVPEKYQSGLTDIKHFYPIVLGSAGPEKGIFEQSIRPFLLQIMILWIHQIYIWNSAEFCKHQLRWHQNKCEARMTSSFFFLDATCFPRPEVEGWVLLQFSSPCWVERQSSHPNY